MKSTVGLIVCVVLLGCGPPPPARTASHVKQVRQAVAKGGGETNILNESRELFARLSMETNSVVQEMADNNVLCRGLSGIPNLGDVLYYNPSSPDRIEVRIHNSHFDTYLIVILNPDFPVPAGFERIAGNVGFIEPERPSN